MGIDPRSEAWEARNKNLKTPELALENDGKRSGVLLIDYGHSFDFRASFDHLYDALARGWLLLASGGERAIDSDIVRTCDHQLFRGKAGNHLVARFGDDDFFLDPRRAPAICRRPEGFQSEDHSRLNLV